MKKWLNIRRDEKAVSPVIGVILMVAITVILAAVIASFVFGIGSKAPKTAPTVQFTASANSSAIVITDTGGQIVNGKDLKLMIYYASNMTVYKVVDPFTPNKGTYWHAGNYSIISPVPKDTYKLTIIYKPANQEVFTAEVTVQ